jgi:hypothetical protein
VPLITLPFYLKIINLLHSVGILYFLNITVTEIWTLPQVAETQRYANLARKQVIIEYDTKDLKPPILTVEQAVQNNSYFNVPPERYPNQVGDFSKGMAEADHKIMSTEVCSFHFLWDIFIMTSHVHC